MRAHADWLWLTPPLQECVTTGPPSAAAAAAAERAGQPQSAAGAARTAIRNQACACNVSLPATGLRSLVNWKAKTSRHRCQRSVNLCG